MPCDESLPGLGIGMTNEVFPIDGRWQDLRNSLYTAVRCSVARGPRFFKWKMLIESLVVCSTTPTALVNDSASSRDIHFTSFDT